MYKCDNDKQNLKIKIFEYPTWGNVNRIESSLPGAEGCGWGYLEQNKFQSKSIWTVSKFNNNNNKFFIPFQKI